MDLFIHLSRCSFQVNWHFLVVLPLSSQVTVVRQEYEGKIKGLMPAELRQELEDTITSLKAQVRADCLPDTDKIQARLEQTRWHIQFGDFSFKNVMELSGSSGSHFQPMEYSSFLFLFH